MPVLSFAFDKIEAEHKKQLQAPLKVRTAINITDLKEEEITLSGGRKDMLLRFFFEYKVDYQPNQASVLLAGNVLYSGAKEDLQKIIQDWKKTKKFNPTVSKDVLNNVFLRCNIKALTVEQDIALPPHIVLPRLQTTSKNKAEDYIG